MTIPAGPGDFKGLDSSAGLDQLARATPFAVEAFLPLGSWRVNLRATDAADAATLGSLLRQSIGPRQPLPEAETDLELCLVRSPADGPLFGGTRPGAAVPDGSVAAWWEIGPGLRAMNTGWFHVVLWREPWPRRAVIFIREPQHGERAFRDHLLAVLCKLLFTFDRFYLHAAGVAWTPGAAPAGKADRPGPADLFVGRGSQGKTTLALALARAGATVLSEDHVLLARGEGGFTVSGCQDTVRVTPATEAWFFDRPLDLAAEDGPGGPKKTLPLAAVAGAAPYVDFPIGRIFFNRIGDRIAISPLPRSAALLRLIEMTRGFYRHNAAGDLDGYLAFFADLVRDRACYDLGLSRDLGELARVVDSLGRN